jgi:dTDP-glucose pyrophosphorylase
MRKYHTRLIPMAGAGQRFLDAGYSTPKPLIPVSGKPMVIAATECLPPADQHIFVCRDFHVREAQMDELLKKYFPGAEVIAIESLTEGQASTCLLARELLSRENTLTIGACDNGMIYDRERFDKLLNEVDTDVIIWTFRNNPAVLFNPSMYGWVKTAGDVAIKVSVKIPISQEPMKDHAVIGAFTFARAGDFMDCVDQMIADNRRVNNEFYMDMAMNVAIEKGLKVKVFEVDSYICWGTPLDVRTYEYWEKFFAHQKSMFQASH